MRLPVRFRRLRQAAHGLALRSRQGRDQDPVARHADLETASIPTELDFGRYRHAQEVTDSMSIETVDGAPAPPRRWRWFGTAPPKPASSRSRRDRCPTIRGISR